LFLLRPLSQVTPNTPYSNWLWILGVDYHASDLSPYLPVTVSVTVEGSSIDVPELCPASATYGSSASCEYIIAGTTATSTTGGDWDACCPKGVTSYYTPQRLQYSAGYTWVHTTK
jgi:hypothetical protein